MAFKAMLFLFTTLLVVTTTVSCHDDELSEAPTHPPHRHHPLHGPHHAHPPATYAHLPKAHAHPPHHEHHHEIAPSEAPHHEHPPTHAYPPKAHPPLKSAHNCTCVLRDATQVKGRESAREHARDVVSIACVFHQDHAVLTWENVASATPR